ncbi:polymer-forming cytoskeletal protein [Halosimplex halophilum]|uniref:polymer-forming cytoskeletal protein n=1 Tax=Halosimplex halophilum TaxID=2559572 RepID=UPI00107EF0F7|nr:polymer-forming cytoskeletal protein [Halosimplex halophilum]
MRRGIRREAGWSPTRGQSNVIAVVLLAGLVLAGATVVVVAGSTAINQAQSDSSFASAEQSMRSLGAEIDSVSRDGQSADVQLDALKSGDAAVEESAGSMTVTVVHKGSGATDSHTVELGRIQYEQGQRTLVYQGGGLFERTGNGSAVVSAPEVSYRQASEGGTLTVPVVAVTGEAVDDEVTVERTAIREILPKLDGNPDTGSDESVNPLKRGTALRVTVESEVYRAWGSVFEQRIGTGVEYDPDKEQVSFTLDGPPERGPPVTRAAFSSRGVDTHVGKFAGTSCYHPTRSSSCTAGDVYLKSADGGLANCFTVEGDLVIERLPASGSLYGSSGCGGATIEGKSFFGERRSASSPYEIKGDVTFEGYTSIHDTVTFTAGGVNFEDDVRIDGKVKKMRGVTVEESLYVEPNPSSNELKINDGTVVKGDLVVNGRIKVNGNVRVHGEVYAEDEVKSTGWGGLKDENGDPKPSSEIHENLPSSQVLGKMPRDLQHMTTSDRPSSVDMSKKEPTTGDSASDISSGTLDCDPDGTAETCHLDAGTYKLDHLELGHGDELELDTSGGSIKIYVEGGVEVPKNAEIQVLGDNSNRVAVFVEGAGASSNTFHMYGGSGTAGEVTTPDDKASKFWVYMDPSDEVRIKEHSDFTGVIYGPGNGPDGDGVDVYLDKHATVRGAVVGNLEKFTNSASIKYDVTLQGRSALMVGTSDTDRVAYFRTSARVVGVDG